MPRNVLAQFAARAIRWGSFGDIRRMQRQAVAIQRSRLIHLPRTAADTEWGRAHRFGQLLTAADPIQAYQRCVPLTQFTQFEASIARARRGEADILWPGTCSRFGLSGGTYSTGKIVPANSEMLARTIRSGV